MWAWNRTFAAVAGKAVLEIPYRCGVEVFPVERPVPVGELAGVATFRGQGSVVGVDEVAMPCKKGRCEMYYCKTLVVMKPVTRWVSDH
jgi:hypothetical protein